jgi:hypothetical protein
MKNKLFISTLFFVAVALAFISTGCSSRDSGMRGTYSDSTHSVILELNSGGKAVFTAMGTVNDCTYAISGMKLTVNCQDEQPIAFTIHDNGSLTGPPDSFMPALRKEK